MCLAPECLQNVKVSALVTTYCFSKGALKVFPFLCLLVESIVFPLALYAWCIGLHYVLGVLTPGVEAVEG